MSEIRLKDLEGCFVGANPASIATCSPEGIPNLTYLSVIHYVDDSHLALSFQFFNKTHQNVLANPKAQLMIPEAQTMLQYRIDISYVRTETEGPIFDRLRTNLDAVASQTGMQDVFRLRGADIYRVLGIERMAHDLDLSQPEGSTDFVAALETLSTRMAGCDELEPLLDTTLAGLAELFDYQHSMILLSDDAESQLYMVASRGFERSGVGAEIAFGEGLIGTAARDKRPVRIGQVQMEVVLAEAVRSTLRERGDAVGETREIPLPGLPDLRCQVAVPMLARDRVLGVLCVQSAQAGRLTLADEQALSTLGRYLATSIQLLGPLVTAPAGPQPDAPTPTAQKAMVIRYHASDDSIFIDDEYLIKGVPGRILHRMLGDFEREGRVDFSNKELRVDAGLRLGLRDNLEARLILLRRRLEERGEGIRLVKTGRGRFRLDLQRPFKLSSAA